MGKSLSKYTDPRVSSGPISMVFCNRTGPVSSPLSGQKIVSPVSDSPWMIGQLMELGPRCLGNNDGWYWMVPLVGASNISSGTMSVTKAITPKSAFNALNASIASWARIRRNCNTGISRSWAATFSGSRGRPSRSGGTKTPTTFSPCSVRASRTLPPKASWPIITMRMSPAMLFHLFINDELLSVCLGG